MEYFVTPLPQVRHSYFFIDNVFNLFLHSSDSFVFVISDHLTVMLEIQLSNYKRTPPLWKFNSLFADKEFGKLILNTIDKNNSNLIIIKFKK